MAETNEKKAAFAGRKKWGLIAVTIAVISLVFTVISWKSMHPSKTVTMEKMKTYAKEKLLDDIECINDSYVVLIYDEKTQSSEWFALESTEEDKAEVEALAETAGVQIKEEKISPPIIFVMYFLQFFICYGLVWGVWRLYGKLRIGKRKEHYRV